MLTVGVLLALLASALLLAPPLSTPAAASGPAALSGSVATDRAALVALYDSTGGVRWTNNTNWKTSAVLGQWHGVTTNHSGRVIKLELPSNNLTGPMPTQLGNLSQLTVLSLSRNNLTGTIPASLGNLSQLTVLSLYRNGQLNGSIPSSLGNLSKLRTLHLYRSQLSGPIPSSLGNLSDLTSLNLAVNQLSDTIPASLGNLSKLTELNLHTNRLSGRIPGSLVYLSKLTRLQLRGNTSLTGCIPIALQYVQDNDFSQVGLPFCSVGVPANLTAETGANAGQVILRWTPGTNATVHRVEYKKDGGNWRTWSSQLSGSTSRVTITGLQPGQNYRFAVKAGRGSTWSSWSRIVSAEAGEAQYPGNPTNLMAKTGINAGEVILSWTPGTNATVHRVYLKKSDGTGGRFWSPNSAGDATSVTITGLESGQTYNFWVKAGRGSPGNYVWSQWTPLVSATAGQAERPSAPTNLTAYRDPYSAEVWLDWTPAVNAEWYQVAQKKGDNGDWVHLDPELWWRVPPEEVPDTFFSCLCIRSRAGAGILVQGEGRPGILRQLRLVGVDHRSIGDDGRWNGATWRSYEPYCGAGSQCRRSDFALDAGRQRHDALGFLRILAQRDVALGRLVVSRKRQSGDYNRAGSGAGVRVPGVAT